MIKLLSGCAIITDSVGKRLAYTYNEVDDLGNVLKTNEKGSFIVLDVETLNLITQIEDKIKLRLV